MSCLNPMVRVPNPGVDPWHADLTFTGKASSLSGRYRVHNGACIVSPKNGCDPYEHLLDIQVTYPNAQMIPCQRCYACVLLKRAIWTQRLLAEAKEVDSNPYSFYKPLFLTLTYDDAHLKYKQSVSNFGGELQIRENVPTVCKADVVDFLKRLNSHLSYYDPKPFGRPSFRMRYFACTEYGTKSGRPHAHIIMFGVPITSICNPKELTRKSFFKRSSLLSEKWGQGFVSVSFANPATMQYVAGYCLKKADSYDYKGLVEQYNLALMQSWYESKEHELNSLGLLSRYRVEDYFDPWSPPMKLFRDKLVPVIPEDLIEDEDRWGSKGLGRAWYEENIAEIMRVDTHGRFSDKAVGLFKWPCRPAQYFERLFDEEDPKLKLLKAQRHDDKSHRLRLLLQTKTLEEIHLQNFNNALSKFERAKARDNLKASI